MYREYLSQKREHLEVTNIEYKHKLKVINEGFADKVKQLDH